MLKKRKTIGIASCNSCARACETGGKEKMDWLAERLTKDGYNIIETNLIPMACNVDLAKKPDYKSEVIVVLACVSGCLTFQMLFPEKIIVSGLNTEGIGARDGDGNIFIMRRIWNHSKLTNRLHTI